MPSALDISRVGFIVLRQTRRPLMTLLVVYAFAIMGMTLIPGVEVDGKPEYMSIFHAFYFMTYTATTTGFGEIPREFSEGQRLWAIVCLYVSVIAWFYAIGSIIRLFQNPYFRRALAERRFTHAVERISEPFYILCGFGDTGSLLARGLSDAAISAVILEQEDARIKALALRDYSVPMPGLCADASVPKHLLEAGIQRPNCRALVAVTNNEEVNLKISAMGHLLNPAMRIITLSKVDIYEQTLATLSRDLHIVDPFKTFAKGLGAAIYNPALFTLNEWLVGARGATLEGAVCAPRGSWVICGYGRLGHEVHAVLASHGIPTAIIDPHEKEEGLQCETYVVGSTTAKTLREAGIERAVGILAGTDDDGHNLGILVNARSLNPNLFTIVRQNRHENELAFAAAHADVIMQPSLVTARRILFLLIAPLMKDFIAYLIRHHSPDNNLMGEVIFRLNEVVGGIKPHLVTNIITAATAPAVIQLLAQGETVLLGEILRDPRERETELALVPLVLQSGEQKIVLPDNAVSLREGDHILFCGRENAHQLLASTLNNEYSLHYVRTGEDKPRGFFGRWLQHRYGC